MNLMCYSLNLKDCRAGPRQDPARFPKSLEVIQMAIYRWAPLREVAALQNRMNSLLQDFSRGNGNDELVAAGFVPPVDIYEDEQRVVLKLEVPGLKEEDLDIRVE